MYNQYMTLDGIILSKIKENIKNSLPIRINKISAINNTDILLNVHSKNNRRNLLISTHSVYNRIHFTNKNYNSLDTATNFVMSLRKHLINGIIYDCIQIEYDRYLILKIKNLNELYDSVELELRVELMGKYANIILLNPQTNKIIDALKKIPPFENNKRTIQTGASFIEIEKQNKKDPFEYKEDLSDLSKKLQGFSLILEKEIYYRLKNNEKFNDIMSEIKNSKNLFIYKEHYHIIELKHLEKVHKIKEINNGFDDIFDEFTKKERIKLIANDIYRVVKNKLKHFKSKITKINEQLLLFKNYEDFKNKADILYMSDNLNLKGLENIELYDYQGNIQKIILDPKLNIKENANKYYQKYTKYKKGIVFQEKELKIAKEELEYFESLNEQLNFCDYHDALEIKEELIEKKYLRGKQKNTKKQKKLMPNIYSTKINNKNIFYGKNNIQNAYLTFKKANKKDMWFHAKDYHGAHVVIEGNILSEDEIRTCAMIAGYFSNGRLSSSIPVNYCLIKDIKKINGALVTITNYKTIYIDIDEKYLQELNII